MSAAWLLDSNVLMAYLNQDQTPGLSQRVERALIDGAAVSVITTIEVLGWRGHDARSRQDAERLLNGLTEISLTRTVVLRVIELRSHLSIKLPDAVIAASALIMGLPLMTRNVDDFKRVDGLTLDNPFSLQG